ncbi:MAG: hypothetical protein K8S23_03175, partial [Candidatus Cloacimonetes bacterium]|nr:hypothetical protein [Candidatus Cloacimonadota bacterium]
RFQRFTYFKPPVRLEVIDSQKSDFIKRINVAEKNIKLLKKANFKLPQTNHLSVWKEVFNHFLGLMI